MATLIQNLKTVFPLTPEPPNQKVLEISTALQVALSTHVLAAYVPVGFGSTFISSLVTSTPFLVSLGSYLDLTISPILSTALTLETNPSSPQPHLLAWGSVQGAFEPLVVATPPFMGGIDGFLLWQAILITIRFFLLPEFPPPPTPDGDSISGDDLVTLEDAL